MQKKHFVLFTLFIGFWMLLSTHQVFANTGDFSIRKIDNVNQTKEATFYDLLAKPATTINLTIEIKNSGNQSAEYRVDLRNAITNNYGKIVYAQTNQTPKSTSPTLAQLNPTIKRITLAANQTQQVSIPITLPKTATPGIILGAIHVEKVLSKAETPKNTQVINHYSMEIPVVVRSMPSSTPQLNLKLTNIKAGLGTNRQPAILATLHNPTAWVLSPMSVDAKVYPANQKKAIYTTQAKKLDLAPNSEFDFGIATKKKDLKPGRYRLDLVAKSNQYNWHFSQYFTIKKDSIKAIDKQLIHPKKAFNFIWLLIILLLLIILYLLYRLHRKANTSN